MGFVNCQKIFILINNIQFPFIKEEREKKEKEKEERKKLREKSITKEEEIEVVINKLKKSKKTHQKKIKK